MKVKINIEENKIYSPLKGKWKVLKPEEKVKQYFIARLVDEYGYALNQMDEELKVSRTRKGQGKARADILIWKNEADRRAKKNAFLVVECKAENISIDKEDCFQGVNYASLAHAELFAITNEKEIRCFRVLGDRIPAGMEPVRDIPNAADMDDPLLMEKLRSPNRPFSRDEFQRLLFKCHSIIRNNDKLSPESAFDEISKILFIKMQYEKKNGNDFIFTLEEFKRLEKEYNGTGAAFLNHLFDETRAGFSKYRLFEEHETIRIKQAGFEQIIGELEPYNLADTADDVRGIAFEEFLGKTFRGELGQFFTPRTIVDFMVKILDPTEGEMVCDPCCGSGGFLIKTFQHIRSKIVKAIRIAWYNKTKSWLSDDFEHLSPGDQREILKWMNHELSELDTTPGTKSHYSILNDHCTHKLFGADANPRMARVAKMNMVMHGDGSRGVYHHDGLLDVGGIFENTFDIILTNPPFGAWVSRDVTVNARDIPSDERDIMRLVLEHGNKYRDSLERLREHVDKSLPDLFDLGKVTTLTEVLFLERCLRLLKPGGRMGIVLPEGVLNAGNLQKVREYVEDRARILLIVSLPREVFLSSGATIKPSVVFLKKFTKEEARHYKSVARTVTGEIKKKYTAALKRAGKKHLKDIDTRIHDEIRREIKRRCNYEILLADVRKAGISSTGTPDENQLPGIARHFETYRKANNLWKDKSYDRIYLGSEDELFIFDTRKRCADGDIQSGDFETRRV